MNAEEKEELEKLSLEISELILNTEWNLFKSKDSLQGTLETKALLINARIKVQKILL